MAAKTKSLAAQLLALIIAGSLCMGLAACAAKVPAEPEAEVEPAAQEADQEDEAEQQEADPEPEAEAEPEEAPGDLVETQRVGNATVGFVNIPAGYVEFQDFEGGDDLQYSDISGTSIFTLNTFDMSSVPEDMRDIFDVRSAAEAVWNNIEEDGAQDVEGAIVDLAGVNAYQVYGKYEDGVYLVCWLVGAPDGSIHYLAVEGPEETIYDNVALAEASYGFTL